MPTHSENRILPYTPEQMFDLVADIEKYPEFLPWCSRARIIQREADGVLAELTIGYKMIRERFVSRVYLDRRKKIIRVEYVSGPLRSLQNEWQFSASPKNKCQVNFFVHFEFSSRLLSKMMDMFFDVAFRRMVSAFEARAKELYG